MIGVFGGTFDPVHWGHLRAAQAARRLLALDELRVIPVASPSHRPVPLASAADRLEMVRRALVDQPGLVVDAREIERGGSSYTVETLASLRAELGDDVPICLLIGADAAAGLAGWRNWREIPRLAHLVVLHRPGHAGANLPPELSDFRLGDADALRAQPAGGVLALDIPEVDVSATAVREAIAAGQTIAKLVPAAVAQYIGEHRLYTGVDFGSL